MAGAETAIKAIRAALYDKECNCLFQAKGCEPAASGYTTLMRAGNGYECYSCKLDFNTYQLVAVAKYPGLMLSVTDEALWREFRGTRFTTPLLKRWVPWLRQRLIDDTLLEPAKCFGPCSAGILTVSQQQLDEMVSSGVRQGELEFC